MYFRNFPTMDYNMDTTDNTTTVTDVFRRVGVRKSLNSFIANYYERILNAHERPEVVSFEEYDVSDRHWILMMINNIEDPYYDWILSQEQLDKFVESKYPGKTIVFPTTHLSDGSYGAVESNPIERFFAVGETITEYLANGTTTGVDGIGVVTEFDPTNLNLSYSITSGTFEVVEGTAHFVKGDQSGAVGNIISLSNHTDAPHHYEDSDSNIIDRTVGESTITNRYYEELENEKKRRINVLMSGFADKFDAELKTEINR
jgi:hypothetical protein